MPGTTTVGEEPPKATPPSPLRRPLSISLRSFSSLLPLPLSLLLLLFQAREATMYDEDSNSGASSLLSFRRGSNLWSATATTTGSNLTKLRPGALVRLAATRASQREPTIAREPALTGELPSHLLLSQREREANSNRKTTSSAYDEQPATTSISGEDKFQTELFRSIQLL
ncbi:hypothetical protein KY290_010664 [Solanum tuberosum]|uniref:Uncharacterized protein n=1 Tax=Solanum tuberosum TaxID=4113 RepID=A0ABQ7VYF0_SOLTU|nr:hypothetical protein KY290_010664 [Solanum tuberosum]